MSGSEGCGLSSGDDLSLRHLAPSKREEITSIEFLPDTIPVNKSTQERVLVSNCFFMTSKWFFWFYNPFLDSKWEFLVENPWRKLWQSSMSGSLFFIHKHWTISEKKYLSLTIGIKFLMILDQKMTISRLKRLFFVNSAKGNLKKLNKGLNST